MDHARGAQNKRMEKQEAMVWLKSIDGVWLMLIAAAIGVIATLAVGKILIPMLQRLKCGQTERDDGPQSHLSKSGTPTMGGLMMLAGVLLACVATVAGDPEFVITAVFGDVWLWFDRLYRRLY